MIAFRVDASHEIGTGHVMRCMTLAEELRAQGLDSIFVCKAFSGDIISIIESKGFVVKRIGGVSERQDNEMMWCPHSAWLRSSWECDAARTLELLPKSTRVLVVDHYALDFQWEQKVSSAMPGIRILVIDDLADRKHRCDALVDQTYRRLAEDYSSYLPRSTATYIGSQYSLLRREFRDFRLLGSTDKEAAEEPPSLLINLGGSDISNETLKLVCSIDDISESVPFSVHVIVGANYRHHESLEAKMSTLKRDAKLYFNISNMAEVIARADLAIGAGGMSAIERCCMGVPSLILPIAKNQALVTKNLCSVGAADYLPSSSSDQVERLLTFYLSNKARLLEMKTAATKITDGEGASRVAAVVRELHG